MKSPRRDLIKIAVISRQARRSLAEDGSLPGGHCRLRRGRERCWGWSRAGEEPGLQPWEGNESTRCVWQWLNDGEKAEEITGKGRAAGQALCLTWRCPGLALMAGWCRCLLQGILKRCFQEGN